MQYFLPLNFGRKHKVIKNQIKKLAIFLHLNLGEKHKVFKNQIIKIYYSNIGGTMFYQYFSFCFVCTQIFWVVFLSFSLTCVLVVEVVGMLPDVDAKERDQALRVL